MKSFSLIAAFFVIAFPAIAEQPTLHPKREVRAVWLTTASGLDWPKSRNPASQQKELRTILRHLHAAHFNTIFFQVRARGDAYYNSAFEPWAENLTGTAGKDPGYDPLAFLLVEARELGMEVHAWFNVFKIGNSGKSGSSIHPSKIFPAFSIRYENDTWFDPGVPEVRQYLVRVAMDLVRKYDIDGIHFDYIRYPGKDFPDDGTFRKFGRGTDRAEWRRGNVTNFVEMFFDSVKTVRPLLKIGSAPLGVFIVGTYAAGWGAYHSYFQDSKSWLNRRIHDYLAPQLYWDIGESREDPDFARLVHSWRSALPGRHVYVGIGAYKTAVMNEIVTQIDTIRALGGNGQAFFRYEHIAALDIFRGRYDHPAIIPPMPWKDSIPPPPPGTLAVSEISPTMFSLEWTQPQQGISSDTVCRYAVYRWHSSAIPFNDGSALVAVLPAHHRFHVDSIRSTERHGVRYHYAVTALDRMNNESAPVTATVTVREVARLQNPLSSGAGLSIVTHGGGATLIAYKLPSRMEVSLDLFDNSGGNALTLMRGEKEQGTYVVGLEKERLKPGSYLLRLTAEGSTLEQPLQLSR